MPKTVAQAWSNPEFVQAGVMRQEGFSKLCVALEIKEMSFEACYLNHLLSPTIGGARSGQRRQTVPEATHRPHSPK